MRAKFGVLEQTHGVRLRAKFRLDRLILSPSGGKPPNFGVLGCLIGWLGFNVPFQHKYGYSRDDPFFGSSAFYGVASWQQSAKVP